MDIRSLPLGSTTLPGLFTPTQTTLAQRLLAPGAISLLSCLLWRVGPQWHIPRRIVHDVMLFVPLHGRVVVRLRDRNESLAPGQWAVLPPGLAQSIRYADGEHSLTVLSIHLHAFDPLGIPLLSGFDRGVFTLPQHEQAIADLMRMTSLFGQDEPLGRAYGEPLLARLLADLAFSLSDPWMPPTASDPRIAGALHAIHADHGRGVSIDEIAVACGLGEVQFRTCFRKVTGQTPKRYLDQVRLRRAADLLRRSHDGISAIAEATGFGSLRQFEIRFKQTYAVTPGDYRRRPAMGDGA